MSASWRNAMRGYGVAARSSSFRTWAVPAGHNRGSALLAAGAGRAHVAPSHGREQGVHADPVVGRTRGQRHADDLAPGLGRGQDIAGALALYLLDPAELVDHRMSQPALPQLADDLSRRRAQRGTALRGQPEPPALDLGKPTGP